MFQRDAMCEMLWCEGKNGSCFSRGSPMAEGSKCGENLVRWIGFTENKSALCNSINLCISPWKLSRLKRLSSCAFDRVTIPVVTLISRPFSFKIKLLAHFSCSYFAIVAPSCPVDKGLYRKIREQRAQSKENNLKFLWRVVTHVKNAQSSL